MVSDVTITVIGKIEELKQQDYKGKRVHNSISVDNGLALTSKMGIGVNKDLKKNIALKSILRHNIASARFKDIFDICYLSDKVSDAKLKLCIKRYIFEAKNLEVNTKADIVSRMECILTNKMFISNIKTSKKN